MADGINGLFAALAGDSGAGDFARLGHGIGGELGRIAGAGAVTPPEPGHALSATLGARSHGAGSHLAVPQTAHAGRGRPAYMARTGTQAARALALALSRTGS